MQESQWKYLVEKFYVEKFYAENFHVEIKVKLRFYMNNIKNEGL